VLLLFVVGSGGDGGWDPVGCFGAKPRRIRSIHCKDWSPDPAKGSQVLFGEGVADWKKIFEAAESVGGLEYYLIEQEGSRVSEIETARKCLATYRTVHPQ